MTHKSGFIASAALAFTLSATTASPFAPEIPATPGFEADTLANCMRQASTYVREQGDALATCMKDGAITYRLKCSSNSDNPAGILGIHCRSF